MKFVVSLFREKYMFLYENNEDIHEGGFIMGFIDILSVFKHFLDIEKFVKNWKENKELDRIIEYVDID